MCTCMGKGGFSRHNIRDIVVLYTCVVFDVVASPVMCFVYFISPQCIHIVFGVCVYARS